MSLELVSMSVGLGMGSSHTAVLDPMVGRNTEAKTCNRIATGWVLGNYFIYIPVDVNGLRV